MFLLFVDKTEEDEKEEEMLMEELVDVVNQRSNIVDSIDEDRIRYLSLYKCVIVQKLSLKYI